MKKILLLVISFLITSTINAQEPTNRVYAELLGTQSNVLGLNKNCKVTIDLGQFQSTFKDYKLQDENGKDIKFNSMVDAMNYMGKRGWKFVQAYFVTIGKQHVYHWLLYKDVKSDDEIFEGLKIKHND